MKLCKDCKHLVVRQEVTYPAFITGMWWWKKEHYCTPEPRPVCMAPIIDVVSGDDFNKVGTNPRERRSYITDQCGPDGKLWEPKE